MPVKSQSFDNRQVMHRDTFEIFRYKDSRPREVALHHHDFYEIYFFISGHVRYNIESRSYQLSGGDILLISPMELHQPIFTKDQQNYERIVLWLNKSFLEKFGLPNNDLTSCFDTANPGHTNLLHPEQSQRQMLLYLLEQMMIEEQTEGPYREVLVFSYLAQILAMINRQAHREPTITDHRQRADSVVYDVLDYINEHYREELSLDFLANKFFISKYHLSREFNRIFGTSVYRYIIQKRLVMAKQMMSEGTPSSEVYQHCGFGDYSNFYRAFKSEYQISPKEFTAGLKATTYRRNVLRDVIG